MWGTFPLTESAWICLDKARFSTFVNLPQSYVTIKSKIQCPQKRFFMSEEEHETFSPFLHLAPTHWLFSEFYKKLHGCVHPTNTDCSEELGLCRALLVLAEFLLAFLVAFLVLEHSEHNFSPAPKCPELQVSFFVSLNIHEPDPSKEEARVKRSRIISVWVLENNSLCFETQITANFFSKLLHENILKRSTWFQEEIRTIPYGEPSACVIRTWQSNEGKMMNIDTSSFIFSTIK